MKKILYGIILVGISSAGITWAQCAGRCSGQAPVRGRETAQCRDWNAMPNQPLRCEWHFNDDIPPPSATGGGNGNNSGNDNTHQTRNASCPAGYKRVPVTRRASTPTNGGGNAPVRINPDGSYTDYTGGNPGSYGPATTNTQGNQSSNASARISSHPNSFWNPIVALCGRQSPSQPPECACLSVAQSNPNRCINYRQGPAIGQFQCDILPIEVRC